MYVVYNKDTELIVCTQEDEADVIRLYFMEGGRDLDEYDKTVQAEPVHFWANLRQG